MKTRWELVCLECGYRYEEETTRAREILDHRDVHQFETSHAMDVYVYLDNRKIKLVGIITRRAAIVDL